MPPNTTTIDETTQQFEKLNLKKLAREVGCSYQVFPKDRVSICMYFIFFFFLMTSISLVPSSSTFRAHRSRPPW
jgi:hypothetical protein